MLNSHKNQNKHQDLLPTHLKTSRIMTFGYNANVAFDTSKGRISTFAENLLGELYAMRTKSVVSLWLQCNTNFRELRRCC